MIKETKEIMKIKETIRKFLHKEIKKPVEIQKIQEIKQYTTTRQQDNYAHNNLNRIL